jgi:hypothetical protein
MYSSQSPRCEPQIQHLINLFLKVKRSTLHAVKHSTILWRIVGEGPCWMEWIHPLFWSLTTGKGPRSVCYFHTETWVHQASWSWKYLPSSLTTSFLDGHVYKFIRKISNMDIYSTELVLLKQMNRKPIQILKIYNTYF